MSNKNVKAIMAFVTLGAIVVGFFVEKLSPEYATGIFGLIIAHYFESQKTDLVLKQVEDKEVEIQSLKSEVQSLSVK